MYTNGFANVSIADTDKVDDKILHVYTKHALIQSIGYLKYKLAHDYKRGMAMRGQRKLYGSLTPSLFHGIKHKSAMVKKRKELEQLLSDIGKEYMDISAKNPRSHCTRYYHEYLPMAPDELEPLLQHYGIQTTWLDLVDNIWVALWFACHKAQQFRCDGLLNYSIYEKRSIFRETMFEKLQYKKDKQALKDEICDTNKMIASLTDGEKSSDYCIRNNRLEKYKKKLGVLQKNLSLLSIGSSFCYLILVGIPLKSDTENKIENKLDYKKETVLDLRSCYPSIFLRPHAQHGLLFKDYHLLDDNWDYSDYVEGVIRMDLTNALEWLGTSDTLSSSMLFPSPVKDYGLQKLLKFNSLRQKIEIVTA